LAAQLNDAKLKLAVDDLRQLQEKWESERTQQVLLTSELEQARGAIDAAEARALEVQEQMRAASEQSASISKNYQAILSKIERLDSASTVVRERRRYAGASEADLGQQIASAEAAYAKAQADARSAQVSYDDLSSKLEAARTRCGALEADQRAAVSERRELEAEERELSNTERRTKDKLAQAERQVATAREKLADQLMKLQVEEGKRADLEMQLARAQADAKDMNEAAQAAQESLEQIAAQEKAAKDLVATCMNARDDAKRALDSAQEAHHSLNMQVKALNDLAAAEKRRAGGAVSWVYDNAGVLEGALDALTNAISADAENEALVETMLQSDLLAILADAPEHVLEAARKIDEAGKTGAVTFVLRHDAARVQLAAPSDTFATKMQEAGAYFLVDHVRASEPNAQAVRALLGHIVVCPTLECALELHGADCGHYTFVTRGGEIVRACGKVELGGPGAGTGGAREAQAQGVLARNRQLQELTAGVKDAIAQADAASERFKAAEADLARAQASSLELAEKLAQLKGQAQSLAQSAQAANVRAAALQSNLDNAAAARARHEEAAQLTRPQIEALEADIATLKETQDTTHARAVEIADALTPIRKRVGALNSQLNDAKLERAKLEERSIYAKRMLEGHLGEQARSKKTCQDATRAIGVKRVAQARLANVAGVLDEICRLAQGRADELGHEATRAQNASSESHDTLSAAREATVEAHAAFDQVNAKLNECQVKYARLEVQVQQAVTQITDDCNMSLEAALELPPVENRPELEQAAAQTERKIANLGTVNPDAAREYDELKLRYDYLSAQLSDLDSARRSLARIDKIIDERMRDDFRRTFDTVNANFKEIFATLFPGGTGYLTLTDEENIDESGIEVHAQPAGKRITKMMLMSGGEKSLVALALLFAVYKTRTTPFYILDEVEAALDDTNLRRLTAYIDHLRNETQLIMITHQRRTMEMADVLFGVSMQADGVTKVISQRLEHALKYAE
jgi:chromosome segregation protein